MPWTAPNTYVAGAVLTAAQLNAMQENLLSGGPTYTTAALRDAAITSPYEGQRAYLTAPTSATVTATSSGVNAGGTTAIPTGIQTIYNGSAWVCVTPVASASNVSMTTTTVTPSWATTLGLDGGVPISVTLPTGTTALITMIAQASHSVAATAAYLSFSVSGATTVAAAVANGAYASNATASAFSTVARTVVMTGLTAGVNTFTLNYAGGAAGTTTYFARSLVVQGVA